MTESSDSVRMRWWKLPAVWALFLFLHFSFDLLPSALFRLLGEEGETTFFHMKMLFVAYVIISLVEFAAGRTGPVSRSQFASVRALVAVAYPWLTITIWFTAEAIGLVFRSLAVELVYANVVTAVGIYLALRLEQALDPVEFGRPLKALVAVCFVAAVVSYAAFSLKVPMPFFT
ncbi:MAG: hypothetical protein FDZ75_04925, partial [Actinobacteria bacterium]